MRCGKAVSPSRQRAQASEAADVLSPAEDGGEGGGRSRVGGSGGGGTGCEAGIAMGGVRVVEYQRIDIIEQRPAARPSRVSLRCLLAFWLAGSGLLLPLHTRPLERGRSRDHTYTILGLSLQTAAGVSCFAASRAVTRHPASIPTLRSC
jgi:hypothetical protein